MAIFSRRWALTAAIWGVLAAFGPRQGEAGFLVVSGDENITNALTGNGVAVNAGNQRFFANILAGGDRVLVRGTDPGGIDTPVANTNAFYNTLGGVSSTILGGPLTAATLAGVDLFVGAFPATAFTAGEISALSDFSAGGGSIFLLGDGTPFGATPVVNLNALLVGLGSALRLVPAGLDAGFRTVSGPQIAAHPLNAGVSSFTYTFASQVTGGTTLFTASGGQTIIAVENFAITAVPEPSSLALCGVAGLAGLGYARARRKAA